MFHGVDPYAHSRTITLVSHFPVLGLARLAAVANALALGALQKRGAFVVRLVALAACNHLQFFVAWHGCLVQFLHTLFVQTKPKAGFWDSAVACNV
jgi:hypothetical protein